MSLSCTPSRTPLRDIGASVNQTPKHGNANFTPFKNSRTPKTSPGPALMLAIRLSAKKDMLKNPPLLELEDKENCTQSNTVDGVLRFRNLLSSETERITKLCNKWDDLLEKLQSSNNDGEEKCPDSVLGDIRTTVGQGRLIMRERFHQFCGLVDNCEFGTSEKPVTCQDLQGFWDMIYFQVEDVDAKFQLLSKCQEANWDKNILLNETSYKSTKKVTKKKIIKKPGASIKSTEAAKKRREEFAKKRAEARKRLATAKAEIKAVKQEDVVNVPGHISGKERMTFDAGFFKIDSPIKSPYATVLTPSNRRQTPRGSSMKKQTCTPGSISKLLPTTNDSTLLESTSKTSKSNIEVSKKLEFAGNQAFDGVQTDAIDRNCVVEILIEDNISMENITEVDPSISEAEQHERINPEKLKNSNTEINGDVGAKIVWFPVSPTCTSSGKNEAVLGIDISPPALFSNFTRNLKKKELVCTNSNTEESCVVDSEQATMAENSIESVNNVISSSPAPLVKSTMKLKEKRSVDTEPDIDRDLCVVESPGSTSSNKTGSDNIANFVSYSTQNEPDIDNPEVEAANLSVILDEATKNFEKMSSILCPIDETPHRDSSFSVWKDDTGRLKSTGKVNVDTTLIVENEKSPNKSALQNLLLETMENMKSQLETLQTLNTNYLKTPKSSEVEKLRFKVESLESQNSKLQSELNEEKESRKNDNLSKEEKLAKLLFDDVDNEASDIAYKPHYYRLLAKTKILEAELKCFNNVQPELERARNRISENTQILSEKTVTLKLYGDKLNKEDERLKKAAECENTELLQCKERIEELTIKLVESEEKLATNENTRLLQQSELTSIKNQFDATHREKEILKADLKKVNNEKLSLVEKVSLLEDKLESTTSELNEKSEKCQALEEKINCLGEEIKSAFTEFSTVIQKRDEVISSQQNQIEGLNDENTKLNQNRKMLQDKIETLEYVEDEMRSVQEQLVETEQSLEKSKNVETQLNNVVDGLKNDIESLNQEIEKCRLENSNLQEELDVVKAEAHYMVQQREEELVYGNTRMDHILTMMKDLHTGLHGMIAPEQTVKVPDVPDSILATPFLSTSTPGTYRSTVLQSISNSDASPSLASNGEPSDMYMSPVKKDANSIMWRVDKGIEMFESVIQACADVQLEFHKEIDTLKFNNSVLCKQLAAMKEKLSDPKKRENELEKVLKKRIERLTKETEEKSVKLEDNSRLMRMLSDQNMELAKYKLKYEELDQSIGRRRSRSAKRRSSSAGSLKVTT